jgi:membrane protein
MASLLKASGRTFSRHSGRMLSSAVAFSALLSIAPLLYIALGLASVAVGEGASRASVLEDLSRWIGPDGAATVFSLLEHAGNQGHGVLKSIVGAVVLVYASTRLFSQLKRTLDHLWDIHPRSGGALKAKIWKQIRKRGLALVLVLLVSALIVAVVAVKTVVTASMHLVLPDGGVRVVLRLAEMVASLGTTTFMFAAIFKALPDAKLHWRDALDGALVTGVLFSIGTTAIGYYLGHKTLDALYGPGGSLVLVLLWVHYSAHVFFFGAAVTGELARRRGRSIEPDANGVRIVISEQP